jgi:hypothetical protein
METVGQIKIDFEIFETGNPKILSIADTSNWLYAENKPAYISIKLPGSSKFITTPFKKWAVNNFNSHTLGLSCLKADCTEEIYVNLPDGVYTIKVLSGFEDIEKERYYLKTDVIELELSKSLVAKVGFEYTSNISEQIAPYKNISATLLVAKDATKEGDFIKADRYFQQAVTLLNKQNRC